jgi:UDP-N-acetylglucosamine--N-acetylmuramyl-(pentapeptide) pyrophosphoryl-undecaprenol N-acetylglucosamine transferase
VRPELFKIGKSEARKKLKLDDRPYILTFGGSLGAAKFNEAVSDFAINAAKSGKFQILMGVGKNNDATKIEEKFVQNGINLKNSKNVKIAEYIEDMDVQMNAADVVICRAGAITVSEILVLKKPAILVPSPNVTHNHQEFNAQTVVNAGFGVIIHENELNSHAIEKSIENFLENSEKSLKIEENVGSNALDKIYSVILSVLKK